MTSESVPVLGADYNAERFLRTIHTGSDAGCPTCGLLGIIDAERAASAERIAELERALRHTAPVAHGFAYQTAAALDHPGDYATCPSRLCSEARAALAVTEPRPTDGLCCQHGVVHRWEEAHRG